MCKQAAVLAVVLVKVLLPPLGQQAKETMAA
jgi:hypothetical protein